MNGAESIASGVLTAALILIPCGVWALHAAIRAERDLRRSRSPLCVVEAEDDSCIVRLIPAPPAFIDGEDRGWIS